MKHLICILFFFLLVSFCTDNKKIFVKKGDKTLLYQVFDTTKYKFIEDVEIGINKFGYVERINLQGKKNYIPENLYLFDSLEKLKIDLPNLKKIPDLGKIKSLSHLKIRSCNFFTDSVIYFPKDYIHIDKSIFFGRGGKVIDDIIFPDGMKVNTLSLGSIKKIPNTLKKFKYLKKLILGYVSKSINLEMLPESLEKLDIHSEHLEEFDFNKLPKNIKIIKLPDTKNILSNSKKIFEDGKKRGILVWIGSSENNGVLEPKMSQTYFWAEL